MEDWITYDDYTTLYPDDAIGAAFTGKAADARYLILQATGWRAQNASSEAELEALAVCQGALIHEAVTQQASGITAGNVTSASNDGYSESYVSGTDLRRIIAQRNNDILRRYLSGPDTAWMLYAGGVYHHRARF